MTTKDKELLLKVLCEGLPYKVLCDRLGKVYELVDVDIKRGLIYLLRDELYVPYSIKNGDVVKPYLRPMSSITEEEKEFIDNRTGQIEDCYRIPRNCIWLGEVKNVVDFYNSSHLDWRGLIKKGLALEAHKDMYKINQV
jgi:hypothetical protein